MTSTSLHQAINTLIKLRLSELSDLRVEFRKGIAYWFDRARPETVDGREAFSELNRCKNGLRSTNKKLRKWRAVQAEFDSTVDSVHGGTLWVPLKSDAAKQFLLGKT
jgi:hypothetical protein